MAILLCPRCGSTRLIKTSTRQPDSSIKTKYRCPKCRRTLTDEEVQRGR
jgi:DNA-directed RNA polymerase subunit RPC12/RpoP